MTPTLTGRDLLNAATEWYRENGSLPIPRSGKIGALNVDEGLFYSKVEFHLNTKGSDGLDNSVTFVQACTFPLLAAISLGFNSHTLGQIIHDHNIHLNEITGMGFNDDTSTGIVSHLNPGMSLTPLMLTIETVKAFSANDVIRKDLYKSFSSKPTIRESIAVMHTAESELWPVNQIEAHAKTIMTPSRSIIASPWVSFDYTISSSQTIAELPNANPIDLLRRSGMLSEVVLRKQTGVFEHWEDLAFTAYNEHELQAQILNALTKVRHQPTLDLIVRGLLSISVDHSGDEIDGASLYQTMYQALGASQPFNKVFHSLILKLNLVSEHNFPDALVEMGDNPDVFGDLLYHQQTLVSRVANELLSRPPGELGLSEYTVFHKLEKMSLPGQMITFSPEKLMNHMLDSMSSFLTTNEVDCVNKKDVDNLAMESLSAMTSVLTRHHTLDQSQFQHRSDAIKVQLIKGGFDIKKFKGLGAHARGQILEDRLGL